MSENVRKTPKSMVVEVRHNQGAVSARSVLPWLLPTIIGLPSILLYIWDCIFYPQYGIAVESIVRVFCMLQYLSIESTVLSCIASVVLDTVGKSYRVKVFLAMPIVALQVMGAICLIIARSL